MTTRPRSMRCCTPKLTGVAQAADLSRRTDVLSRLLQAGHQSGDAAFTDAELRAQLVTLLLARHETTAAALAWTLHELARHPDLQHRAYLAAQENDERYLEAALLDSMRLHPVIASTAHKLTRDQLIGGFHLPAGTFVKHLHPAGPPASGQLPRREHLSA